MKRIGSVGITGVITQIGFSGDEEFKIDQEELIESLMKRFEVERYKVINAINWAIKDNLLYVEDDKYCLRTDNKKWYK